LKGFKLSDDDELQIEEDQEQSPCPDNECPDICMMKLAHPQVMPVAPFDFHQFICRLGQNSQTMFKVLEELDSHIPPGPIIVHSVSSGGAVR
jgi:hypothetical protein